MKIAIYSYLGDTASLTDTHVEVLQTFGFFHKVFASSGTVDELDELKVERGELSGEDAMDILGNRFAIRTFDEFKTEAIMALKKLKQSWP